MFFEFIFLPIFADLKNMIRMLKFNETYNIYL